MPASESDRILASGVPITLRDGRTVTLRYSMRSLKAIEDSFGSVDVGIHTLNALLPVTKGAEPANTKAVGTVVPFLAAGLTDITEDDLWDGVLLDPRELLGDYFDAIAAALDEAFPPPGSPGKDAAPEPASNGAASTTPQPPALVGATTSSGA